MCSISCHGLYGKRVGLALRSSVEILAAASSKVRWVWPPVVIQAHACAILYPLPQDVCDKSSQCPLAVKPLTPTGNSHYCYPNLVGRRTKCNTFSTAVRLINYERAEFQTGGIPHRQQHLRTDYRSIAAAGCAPPVVEGRVI